MVDWAAEGKVMPDFAKLENKTRQGAQQEGDLPQWAARQQKVFTNWINNKVADRPLSVCDLFVDLQDGTVLYGLLEVLSKQSLAVLGKVKPERNKIKKIANMNIVWKFLGTTVKLVGIGPTDIVDGNVTLTLGMIWSLIVFFMAQDLGDAGDGLSILKKRIMEWMTKRTRDFAEVNVTNFTASLADGKALLAILSDYDPEECPYAPTDNPADNLRRAFEDFHRLYGVGSILDPDDPFCCDDEKANITYLAELMKAMPVVDEDDEDSDGRGGRRGRGRRLRTEPAVIVDTQKAALIRGEEILPDAVERLRHLCTFGPGDGDSCAMKVAEMMTDAGLSDVKVVKPSQDREDPSMRGDSFVVGEKAGPPGTPTVLFYSSYGTVDESAVSLPSDEEAGDTAAAATESWSSDPLMLAPPPGLPTGDGISGARLAGRGAAQDKANVVCQMAAIEALVKGTVPCGVKVIVGATPPPGSLAGNASLEVTDRLVDFLKAHPAMTGLPDLIVVSEPSGARLAPEKNALLVGCRGFVSLQLSVSTFDDEDGNTCLCADFGGPLIDPARVLTSILASMHDPQTGALKVEGISGPPDDASVERLKELRCDERQLRAEAGYAPQVACAKEAYLKGGQPTPASIVEQLTILPAVTVTSITTTPTPSARGYGMAGGLLGSTFPSAASAGLHVCLPPGREYAPAVQALQAHCTKHAPHGARIRFDKVVGRTGWLAPPGNPIISGVLASLRGEGDIDIGDEEEEDGAEGAGWSGRETVVASSPGFSAIPCAFARALPSASVVGVGVNDPKSKGALANESVLVEDLRLFVRGAVRVVHGAAKSAGRVSAGSAGSFEAPQPVAGGGGARSRAGSATASSPRHDAALTGVAYTHRFIDDIDRRNALNQLRGKRSNASSPTASACTTPRGTVSIGVTNSLAGGSPVKPPAPSVFSSLERGTGGVGGGPVTSRHPLSPKRSSPSTPTSSSSGATTKMTPTAEARGYSPKANSALANFESSSPLGPRMPPPPEPPTAAMAAFAAAALSQAGVTGVGEGFGGGAGMGGFGAPPPVASVAGVDDDDEDKVGGATPETILAEVNELRADPRAYATRLEALVQHYDKSMYNSPTGPPVQTTEGTKPLLEAIAVLKTTKPLEPLESKEGMQQASADHVKDLAASARTGHSGSDGSGAADRMNRYGQFFQVAGEVCTYFDATASGIVAQLLVSDGERSRHNRKALLAEHFKVCGVALGTHPTVGAACVITLAGGYGPRPLAQAADVVCASGETPSAEFREVLESVPVPQILEEVQKCLKAGVEVQLQYSPGQIKCIFVQASGARKSMGCKWA